MFGNTGKKIVTIDASKKRYPKWIRKNKEAYFVVVTMGQKIKTDKIWFCESVGKLKRIGKQEEVKMNEMNIHTIADLQMYVQSYGLPKLPIRSLDQIYEHGLVALPAHVHKFGLSLELAALATHMIEHTFVNQ